MSHRLIAHVNHRIVHRMDADFAKETLQQPLELWTTLAVDVPLARLLARKVLGF